VKKRILSYILAVALLIPIVFVPASEATFVTTDGFVYHVVTTDPNNGTLNGSMGFGSHIARAVQHGSGVAFADPQAPRSGWTFRGWQLSDGEFFHVAGGMNPFYTVLRDSHFIAVWQNNLTGELCPPTPEPCPDCDKPFCICEEPPEPCPDCDKLPCECDEPPITPTGPTLVPSNNNPTAAYINLETETITLPFTAGAYSVNDGRSWKTGSLPELSRLLDRGMTLWAAQGYDKKAKRPTGTVVNFPKIERRPRGNTERLKPANQTDTWELRTRAGDLPTATYLWASTADRKTASGAWQNWSGSQPLPASKQKVTILLRSPALAVAETTAAPARYVPAGRAFRVTAKG
jgi:hypothetical protein